jgi:ABC-2 type transport system permease protein
MRLKATVIVCLKALLSQWKQVILMYCLFPLLLSLGMGYFQKGIFQPEVNMEKIKVTIVDEDNSEISRSFTQMFSTEEMKKLFEVSASGDYLITVPKGFESNLRELKESVIEVDEKKRTSRISGEVIRSLIEAYGKSITQSVGISNKIEALNVTDKEALYSEVSAKVNSVEAAKYIRDNIQEAETTLTSYEYQGATMITFFAMMIVMSCVAGYHMDKENGSFKRLMSTPITRLTFFNLDMLIFFIASFVYGLVYILSFRIAGFAFKGVNPAVILSILAVQSFLISSLAGLMVAFLGKNNSNLLLVIIMYFQILFGGVFIPVKQVNNEVFKVISRFAPGNLISEAYRSSMLFNSFDKITGNLLTMAAVAAALYLISVIKVKVRWEE